MPKAPINGIEIHYDAEGDGTPVMLIAGYGGTGTYWNPQRVPFAKNFRPILMDHRGHGQSTHDTSITYSMDQMADDVIHLMDHLKIDKAHYVGHSLGGVIGQNLGLRYPDRFHDLVIYASITHFDPWIARCIEMRRTLLETAGPRAFARVTPVFLYPDWWVNANTEALERLEEATVASFPPRYVVESRSLAIASYSAVADLHKLKLPTLLLCAKDDFLTPPYFTEHLAKLLPHAEVAWMEDGGHACSQTRSDEFNAIVLEFLSRHEPCVAS
jgi:aminoacrylate hydrolase